MSSYSPKQFYPSSLNDRLGELAVTPSHIRRTWLVFAAAAFLVSVPVFVQAPLVRLFPWLSLACTALWITLSLHLLRHPRLACWGDLLMGFSWTWFAGSIYWGWLRWEPLIHLPIEAIGLPFAIAGLLKGQGKIGHWFYLGSLFGTAMTDLYFYLTDLIPYWRQVMQVEPSLAQTILHNAVLQVQTPWGIGYAIGLVTILLMVGGVSLRTPQLHHWAFGGAVISTLLVDGLFWLGATML